MDNGEEYIESPDLLLEKITELCTDIAEASSRGGDRAVFMICDVALLAKTAIESLGLGSERGDFRDAKITMFADIRRYQAEVLGLLGERGRRRVTAILLGQAMRDLVTAGGGEERERKVLQAAVAVTIAEGVCRADL